jgi:peroxiredoxin
MDSLIPIGAQAPTFHMPDITGQSHSLGQMLGKIIVLNFWSAECPWCERVDYELLACLEAWKDQVRVWWIASNADESSEVIERVAMQRKLPAVLLDHRQQVANLYGAQTTPHFFIIEQAGKLAYQGAWDDITFRQRVASQVYVPEVIDALRDNHTPRITQTPPYGCVLVRVPEIS